MRTKYFFTQILQAIPKSRKNDLSDIKESGLSGLSFNKKTPHVFSK